MAERYHHHSDPRSQAALPAAWKGSFEKIETERRATRSHYTLVSLKGQHISSVFRLRSRVAPVVIQSQHPLFTNSIEVFCTFYTQRVTHAAPPVVIKAGQMRCIIYILTPGGCEERASQRSQAASTLQDRSLERVQCVCVCVNIVYGSACIRNRSIRGSGCSTSWMWHIMLRSVAGRQGNISPVWRSGSHALPLATQRQWRVRMWELSCVQHGPPLAAPARTVMALQYNVGKSFPGGYLCQPFNLPFMDFTFEVI